MLKVRGSTQEPEKPDPKEATAEGKKRKERVKKTMARVVGKPSMMEEGRGRRGCCTSTQGSEAYG